MRKYKTEGKHSQRLTNEVKFKPGMTINPLGKRVWVGFAGTDFQDGCMTLRQFVKMPRIFVKK